jgi:hypothetical protein
MRKRPDWAELDDDFRLQPVERATADDALRFASLPVPWSLHDLACEGDVFEVKDRELLISSSSAAWVDTTSFSE